MPDHLALYGTLRRGEENHWVIRSVAGEWRPGTVRGWVYEVTWGAGAGYPGFSPDPGGNRVPVEVLSSEELDRHWDRLDEFEGPGYRRVEVDVELDDGAPLTAWIYEVLPDAE